MFTQLNIYKNFIIAGVIALVVIAGIFYVNGLKRDIRNLNSTLKDNQIELANEKLQSTRYESALDKQNTEINKLRLDNNTSTEKLAKWKVLPAKIRYKVIYKTSEVIKSNECKDIKSSIDNIRNIDFKQL